MKTRTWVFLILLALILLIISGLVVIYDRYLDSPESETPAAKETEDTATLVVPFEEGSEAAGHMESDAAEQELRQDPPVLPVLFVSGLRFEGCTPDAITLSWSDENDSLVETYVLRRKETAGDNVEWRTVAAIPSDGIAGDSENQYTDKLSSTEPVQFCYRVDAVPLEPEQFEAGQGDSVLASNVCVCIDPGHYEHSTQLRGSDLNGYDEGTFMLAVGLRLRDILKEEYGIDTRMTRETGHITLYGFTDSELDHKHLSLRGEYAEGCRLFLSLHTNANLDNANGYGTCNQPIAITKTVLLVNRPASCNQTSLLQANAIGRNVSRCNAELGIASSGSFFEVGADGLLLWSDEYNDSLNTPGTVCVRWQGDGEDYYGVLRGAASVGVPGMIVEHGHHTVAEMRRAAAQDDLLDRWAKADAAGIADGYLFCSREECLNQD